jgi:hypothetical protein
LGLRVEKSDKNGAIVAEVMASTQAERVGLRRGDIVCMAGSNGTEEMHYEQFLAVAHANRRPFSFEVRRVASSAASSAARPVSGRSAADDVRRQAVIAAAEKRNQKNKSKPTSKSKKDLPVILSTKEYRQREEEMRNKKVSGADPPLSEEAQRAIALAKKGEMADAANLGYNPYETARMTAGQAKVATNVALHGAMENSTRDGHAAPPPAPAPEPPTMTPTFVSEPFETTLTSLLSGNAPTTARKSIGIMNKLISNAVTKGSTDDKFLRVRLSNAKIKAALVDVQFAVDLMLLFGFVLYEEGEETFLVYQEHEAPHWTLEGLKRLEKEATSGTTGR